MSARYTGSGSAPRRAGYRRPGGSHTPPGRSRPGPGSPRPPRPDAVRIAEGDHLIGRQHHHRERPAHPAHRLPDRGHDVTLMQAADTAGDHLAVVGALEPDPFRLQLPPKLPRVDDIAIVRHRD